jgi:hypothetical protein
MDDDSCGVDDGYEGGRARSFEPPPRGALDRLGNVLHGRFRDQPRSERVSLRSQSVDHRRASVRRFHHAARFALPELLDRRDVTEAGHRHSCRSAN